MTQWHVVDFKTGTADGVIDQILTYAVIARETLGVAVGDGCFGVIVSLGENPKECVARFEISEDDLGDAERRIQENISRARRLLADQVTGAPRELAAFPGRAPR
jgi:hypothetical protein